MNKGRGIPKQRCRKKQPVLLPILAQMHNALTHSVTGGVCQKCLPLKYDISTTARAQTNKGLGQLRAPCPDHTSQPQHLTAAHLKRDIDKAFTAERIERQHHPA